ncbi:FAD-dependent oxidoreductase [Candidatus Saccharibacteria bacterium]|nr:FAD-dependent oxidoreductase [Candidatus Saccharibacteria bacterium]MCB9821663.1 FAD-dependent oxidoreductase [Candidatus Nomurabacteria bacterium]
MHKYLLADNRLLTPTIRQLTLECDADSEPILHQPGQYAAISLRDRKRPTAFRCFSIASSPTNQRVLQFSIRVGGKYTSALERLEKGDEVAVRGPFGAFVLNQYEHKDLVMFAGGIGVAPFMSMIRYASELKLDNKLHLVYSSRNQNEIAFYTELNQLAKHNPNLTITHVIGEGGTEKLVNQRALQGRLDAQLLSKLNLDFRTQTYMTCGPPPYMNAVISLLKEHGVDRERILSEAFSQSSGGQTGKLAIWPFNMYAMSGLALAIIAFSIVINDLYKTLPILQAQADQVTVAPTGSTLDNSAGYSLHTRVNSLQPQVSTDLTQAPIVKTVPSSSSSSSGAGSYSTTVPVTPPRSTVS